jgi:hypothetical protein
MISVYENNIIPKFEAILKTETKPEEKENLKRTIIIFKQDLRNMVIQEKLLNYYQKEDFIAYIVLLSQLIEFRLKQFISQYKELSALEGYKIKIKKDFDKNPLGSLIDIFEKCINNKSLISNLRKFNFLRKKTIHNLFDVDYTIEEIENIIKEKITPKDSFNHIIIPLLNRNTALINKLARTKHPNNQQLKKFLNIVIEKYEEEEKLKINELEKEIKK